MSTVKNLTLSLYIGLKILTINVEKALHVVKSFVKPLKSTVQDQTLAIHVKN
jgi:hypothetical protein